MFSTFSFPSLHLLLPSLGLLYLLVWTIYARYFHPLARFPGPFFASVSRLWLIIDVAKGSTEKTQRRLHQQYGPIIRIAPNEVAIADPEAIKTIYSAHSGFTKTDFYLPFRATWGRYPDAFTNLDERQHAERRRIYNSVYSMSNIIQMEDSVDKCVQLLIEKLTECATKNNVIDLSQWIQWYSFDTIGSLFFSRPFGFLQKARDMNGYIAALDLLIPSIAVACVSPTYMRPLVLVSGAMIPRVFKALKALKHIELASEECVAQRQQLLSTTKTPKPRDMLQGFFDIMHTKGHRTDFGLTEVKMKVYGAFIAGSDTTAAAITSTLTHILATPHAHTRLIAELTSATTAGYLSNPTIQYHEAIGLPYLMACCKEGMRLHPSVAMTLPRHVPRGGCEIAGTWFEEGCRVGVNAAVVQRDKGVFGGDADMFVPERWLGKEEDCLRMERVMFQFGTGARTCIGKHISLVEMYKVIPQLLRTFEFELVQQQPEKEGEDWDGRGANYWFHKVGEVRIRVKVRDNGGCCGQP